MLPDPIALENFAEDVGGLLIDEGIYTAATINGDSAVATLAADAISAEALPAAVSTLGMVAPPGVNRAIGTAESVAKNWKGPTDYSSIRDPANVTASTKPTPRQVREMKQANRAQNDGELRDDVTGERMVDSKKSESGVTPPSNEAQVDHKNPVDNGGTRHMSNLELRTRKNNRKKSNKKPGE